MSEIEVKPKTPVVTISEADIKQLCTTFFYWWYNRPGSNTEQGYDEWFAKEGEQMLEAAQSDFDARIRSALVERKAEPEECDKCVGTGTVEDAGKPIGMGGFMKCPDCNGTGHASPVGESRDALIERLEDAAKAIYALMPYDGNGEKPDWVERGNSLKQDEARRYARAALSAAKEQP